MIDTWGVWLLIVGFAIGAATLAVLLIRLPRREGDVDHDERRSEAAWIAGIIERYGGVAPISLVEEVLDLHAAYLEQPRPARPASGRAADAYPATTRDRPTMPPVAGALPAPGAPPPASPPSGPSAGYPPAPGSPGGG